MNLNLNKKSISRILAISSTTLLLFACNSPDQSAASVTPDSNAITSSGSTSITATPTPRSGSVPASTPTPTATPVATSGSYPSCVSSDTDHICIGLKIVSYESNGVPDLTEAQAVTLVNGINTVWSQCNIAFQLESFEIIDPTTVGLPYSPDWQSQTSAVRTKFTDKTRMVVIAVGPWNVSTIAVTTMPGSGLYGTVVDQQYSNNPLTVGHELGHYQGLYHVQDTSNLMSAYIGTNTKLLDSGQCSTSRSTDLSNWTAMLRKP
jgi:hypothetical protein